MKISLTKQVATTIIMVGLIIIAILFGFIIIKLLSQKANLKIPQQYNESTQKTQ